MIYKNFRLVTTPHVVHAVCIKCRCALATIQEGLFGEIYFCLSCNILYKLELVKIPEKYIDKKALQKALKKTLLTTRTNEEKN